MKKSEAEIERIFGLSMRFVSLTFISITSSSAILQPSCHLLCQFSWHSIGRWSIISSFVRVDVNSNQFQVCSLNVIVVIVQHRPSVICEAMDILVITLQTYHSEQAWEYLRSIVTNWGLRWSVLHPVLRFCMPTFWLIALAGLLTHRAWYIIGHCIAAYERMDYFIRPTVQNTGLTHRQMLGS